MCSIFDVAKYILQTLGQMTTMKLQKLTYYCQAWSLVWDGLPLFNEDFQAWANGPVCPELFELHKGKFSINESLFSDNINFDFTEEQLETINNVLEYYGNKEPQWLSELTHKEVPWKNTRFGIPIGEPCTKVIEKDLIQQYYGGLE